MLIGDKRWTLGAPSSSLLTMAGRLAMLYKSIDDLLTASSSAASMLDKLNAAFRRYWSWPSRYGKNKRSCVSATLYQMLQQLNEDTHGFGELCDDCDGLVVVVDFDDRFVEFEQRFIKTVDVLGDTFEQQRLPLLLRVVQDANHEWKGARVSGVCAELSL